MQWARRFDRALWGKKDAGQLLVHVPNILQYDDTKQVCPLHASSLACVHRDFTYPKRRVASWEMKLVEWTSSCVRPATLPPNLACRRALNLHRYTSTRTEARQTRRSNIRFPHDFPRRDSHCNCRLVDDDWFFFFFSTTKILDGDMVVLGGLANHWYQARCAACCCQEGQGTDRSKEGGWERVDRNSEDMVDEPGEKGREGKGEGRAFYFCFGGNEGDWSWEEVMEGSVEDRVRARG